MCRVRAYRHTCTLASINSDIYGSFPDQKYMSFVPTRVIACFREYFPFAPPSAATGYDKCWLGDIRVKYSLGMTVSCVNVWNSNMLTYVCAWWNCSIVGINTWNIWQGENMNGREFQMEQLLNIKPWIEVRKYCIKDCIQSICDGYGMHACNYGPRWKYNKLWIYWSIKARARKVCTQQTVCYNIVTGAILAN